MYMRRESDFISYNNENLRGNMNKEFERCVYPKDQVMLKFDNVKLINI